MKLSEILKQVLKKDQVAKKAYDRGEEITLVQMPMKNKATVFYTARKSGVHGPMFKKFSYISGETKILKQIEKKK